MSTKDSKNNKDYVYVNQKIFDVLEATESRKRFQVSLSSSADFTKTNQVKINFSIIDSGTGINQNSTIDLNICEFGNFYLDLDECFFNSSKDEIRQFVTDKREFSVNKYSFNTKKTLVLELGLKYSRISIIDSSNDNSNSFILLKKELLTLLRVLKNFYDNSVVVSTNLLNSCIHEKTLKTFTSAFINLETYTNFVINKLSKINLNGNLTSMENQCKARNHKLTVNEDEDETTFSEENIQKQFLKEFEKTEGFKDLELPEAPFKLNNVSELNKRVIEKQKNKEERIIDRTKTFENRKPIIHNPNVLPFSGKFLNYKSSDVDLWNTCFGQVSENTRELSFSPILTIIESILKDVNEESYKNLKNELLTKDGFYDMNMYHILMSKIPFKKYMEDKFKLDKKVPVFDLEYNNTDLLKYCDEEIKSIIEDITLVSFVFENFRKKYSNYCKDEYKLFMFDQNIILLRSILGSLLYSCNISKTNKKEKILEKMKKGILDKFEFLYRSEFFDYLRNSYSEVSFGGTYNLEYRIVEAKIKDYLEDIANSKPVNKNNYYEFIKKYYNIDISYIVKNYNRNSLLDVKRDVVRIIDSLNNGYNTITETSHIRNKKNNKTNIEKTIINDEIKTEEKPDKLIEKPYVKPYVSKVTDEMIRATLDDPDWDPFDPFTKDKYKFNKDLDTKTENQIKDNNTEEEGKLFTSDIDLKVQEMYKTMNNTKDRKKLSYLVGLPEFVLEAALEDNKELNERKKFKNQILDQTKGEEG